MQTVHKEEANARITAYKADREELRRTLKLCIAPINPEQHPEGIINVVNGVIAPPKINVDRTIEIGTRQMENLKGNCLKDSMIPYQRKQKQWQSQRGLSM